MPAQARERVPIARRSQRAPGSPSAPLGRRVALYAVLLIGLLLADAICSRASLPIVIIRDASGLTIHAGSVTRHIATHASLLAVTLPPRDPVIHEYQLDGTDSTNNFTLDPTYLRGVATTRYYRFYAWMRGLDDLSRWRDLCVAADGQPPRCAAAPPIADGVSLTVPAAASQRVTAALQQPETHVTLDLSLSDGDLVALTIDRNDHAIIIAQSTPTQLSPAPITAFYPTDPGDTWPLAAMTLDLLIRVLLWALALLGAVWAIEAGIGWVWARASPPGPLSSAEARGKGSVSARAGGLRGRRPLAAALAAWDPAARGSAVWARIAVALHPAGLALIAASFAFTVWIALAQYQAQPHIYDASAYLFGAKIFASGRLYAPAPAAPDQFPGPFMALIGGRWFPQYEPGTSATLAVGVLLGVPWLIEPLMGALALLGIGLTLRRLYDRRVATLAVALGALSPFFLWLSASYLSHTVALCYLVWGLWALTRFAQGGRGWNLPLAATFWALAMLTRDTAAPFAAVSVVGLAWVAWRERWPVLQRRGWVLPLVWTVVPIAVYLASYLDYNALLTGNPLLTPRALYFPGDHWGFGLGVGFYGQHTLAAGFITMQELLTSLSISLYGWPFYLTLAFIPLPFLARRARPADVFLLGAALLMAFAFLGYFYHGVYLGPRYLFEALPFLLGLTARGIVVLWETGQAARSFSSRLRRGEGPGVRPRALPLLATPALLLALLACAALYYFPRQIALHTDFTGMATGTTIQTAALSDPPVHHAIVITSDAPLYGYTLFAFNDPLLRGDVLYAYGASASDYAALRRAYPTRGLYLLTFDDQGQPQYTPVDG